MVVRFIKVASGGFRSDEENWFGSCEKNGHVAVAQNCADGNDFV